ncbi:MAG: deoxyribodipyrimidine photolyase, partial [Pirellula sp.]
MPPIANTPSVRVRSATAHDARPDGQYVLYWMTAYRRLESNFALQRATELAVAWNKPLVVLEGLRIGYRWASDRFHRFMIDGMIDNQQAAESLPLTYLAYVEPKKGDGNGLVETLAKEACLIVTDDFPCFFHPKLYKRIVGQWPCAVELVDSNGILPIHAADRTFTVAHSYRRHMQKEIARETPSFPHKDPFRNVELPKLKKLPEAITKRWRFQSRKELQSYDLSKLDIDHGVGVAQAKGGRVEGLRLLAEFAKRKLGDYDQARNEPDQHGSSSLSAHLHFG